MQPETLSSIQEVISPAHTSLLLIDMQKDFCTEGFGTHKTGRDLSATRSIIPNLERLLGSARSSGVLIIHVGFLTLPDGMSDSGPWLAQRRRSTFSSDKLALVGTDGARFIDELSPQSGEVVVYKHRYSAFKGTDLDLLLRAHNVRTVVTAGVSTNVCVESTLREAFELGYYVGIPRDGVASWNMKLHEATLQTVAHRFGLVTNCDEIISCWQSAVSRAPSDKSRRA
jgi:nicotinamidase-related amidase